MKPDTRAKLEAFWKEAQKNIYVQTGERYVEDKVSRDAAALAYYLLFSLFPMLVLFNFLLGHTGLNMASIEDGLRVILPTQMIGLINSYLHHVQDASGFTLLSFSVIFSIYFPWRAVKGLMQDIRKSYRIGKPKNELRALGRQLLLTLLFPLAITLSLFFFIFSQRLIRYLASLTLPGTIQLSSFVLAIWQYGRFAIAALIMGGMLLLIYWLALERKVPFRWLLPGTVASVTIWLIASVLFSFYVENIAHYSVIYGTLATFIILLLWLYLTAIILIMGSEFNALLAAERHGLGFSADGELINIHDKSRASRRFRVLSRRKRKQAKS